jgi:hypothetical protein
MGKDFSKIIINLLAFCNWWLQQALAAVKKRFNHFQEYFNLNNSDLYS